MKTAHTIAWKTLILVLFVFMLACGLYALLHWQRVADPAVAGRIEGRLSDPDALLRRTVLSVTPGSALALAGGRVGDVVSLDHFNDVRRAVTINELIGMTLYSGTSATHFLVPATPRPELVQRPTLMQIRYFVSILMGFLATIFGLVLGWRRADSASTRGFALAMLTTGGGIFFDTFPSVQPAELAFNLAEPVLFTCFFLGFPYFALAGGQRPLLRERPWATRAFALYALVFVLDAAYFIVYKNGSLPPGLWSWTLTLGARRVLGLFSVVASLGALLWNWRTSAGVERERARWIFACMGAVGTTYLAVFIDELLGRPIDSFNIGLVQSLVILLSYSGLCYALLRHKLFDLGFALNRALVYTIISTMLLLVFSITEWAVDKLLHFHGRETNAAIDAMVALGVILSFHRVQHWVGHRVDHTFYRKWHNAAKAFRLCMEKAVHISHPSVLQNAFISAVQAYAAAEGVAVYESNGECGFLCGRANLADAPERIDGNDPFVVELRHAGAAVELAMDDVGCMAVMALPITARGHVHGFVLMGRRSDGSAYRPDQVALLSASVQEFGLHLESLRAEALERDNATMHEQYRVKALECRNAELRVQVLELQLAQR